MTSIETIARMRTLIIGGGSFVDSFLTVLVDHGCAFHFVELAAVDRNLGVGHLPVADVEKEDHGRCTEYGQRRGTETDTHTRTFVVDNGEGSAVNVLVLHDLKVTWASELADTCRKRERVMESVTGEASTYQAVYSGSIP